MKPNFNKINISSSSRSEHYGKEWERLNQIKEDWMTAEKIALKGAYTESDLLEMESSATMIGGEWAWSQ